MLEPGGWGRRGAGASSWGGEAAVAARKARLTFCSVSWRFPRVPSQSPLLSTLVQVGIQFFVRRTPRLQREMRRAQLLVCLLVCPGLGISSLSWIFRVGAIGEGQSRDTCLLCNLSLFFFFSFCNASADFSSAG